MTPSERFWAKVDQSGECWLWTASVVGGPRGGYGQFRAGRKMVKAHVWAYEQLVGPVPDGLRLDHLCRVRHCVNPDHLEPITNRENVKRGRVSDLKEACVNAHPYTPENVKVIESRGVRTCRTCYLASHSRANANRRAS